MVIWLIGMSGAGKSTIGMMVWQRLRAKSPNVIYLDGDEFRAIWSVADENDGVDKYSLEYRKRNGERIVRLCQMLDVQGQHVVCCVLSIFQEQRDYCRRTFSDFLEVFVDTPLDQLVARDSKGIYASAQRGEAKNVVGFDIPFPTPANPDMVIANDVVGADLTPFVDAICARIERDWQATPAGAPPYPYDTPERQARKSPYSYTEFHGVPFLRAWRQKRRDLQQGVTAEPAPPPAAVDFDPAREPMECRDLVEWLWREAARVEFRHDPSTRKWIDRLVKKFETTRKLHRAYGHDFRAVDKAERAGFETWIRFGELLAALCARETDLQLLNCLLKLIDVLSANRAEVPPALHGRLSTLVADEATLVESLAGGIEGAF